jgi:hypothetical protein
LKSLDCGLLQGGRVCTYDPAWCRIPKSKSTLSSRNRLFKQTWKRCLSVAIRWSSSWQQCL